MSSSFFFFNDTATTEIYTLSLHALFRSRQLRNRAFASKKSHHKGTKNAKSKTMLFLCVLCASVVNGLQFHFIFHNNGGAPKVLQAAESRRSQHRPNQTIANRRESLHRGVRPFPRFQGDKNGEQGGTLQHHLQFSQP